jgi:UDP-N-acetylglucosamine--N-acetylmuramyl-(pentapeptide) pyrophosphoryl-undecaprenol N-acetylglucosamine transferase
LPSAPLPRGPGAAVRFLADHLRGGYLAGGFLRAQHVVLVVGLGSYASVPMLRAAIKHRIPYILLEQNVVPGRATRWFARRARLVCLSFAESAALLGSGCRVRVTGNPLRRGFTQIAEVKANAADQAVVDPGKVSRLLVLGGSGGARTLNMQTPLALYKAAAALRDWEIIHQSGESDCQATRELYRKLGLSAVVVPFIDHMARALLDTDLVISRAGGTTLAELAAAGVPAILAPYPKASDDHQRKNADALAAAGGALVIDEREIAGRFDDALTIAITTLVSDANLRRSMSAAMMSHARPNAAHVVSQILRELLAAQLAAA